MFAMTYAVNSPKDLEKHLRRAPEATEPAEGMTLEEIRAMQDQAPGKMGEEEQERIDDAALRHAQYEPGEDEGQWWG